MPGACGAAPAPVPDLATPGRDMALTSGGPVILEADDRWAPFERLPPEGWAPMTGDA